MNPFRRISPWLSSITSTCWSSDVQRAFCQRPKMYIHWPALSRTCDGTLPSWKTSIIALFELIEFNKKCSLTLGIDRTRAFFPLALWEFSSVNETSENMSANDSMSRLIISTVREDVGCDFLRIGSCCANVNITLRAYMQFHEHCRTRPAQRQRFLDIPSATGWRDLRTVSGPPIHSELRRCISAKYTHALL